MAHFQHALAEQAENPLPPALPGETVTETKLHRFRLRQLQDLAQAYGIDLPEGATKNEVLPILVTHERAGVFRQPPRSQYHLLRAELNHDEKLDPRTRAEREQRIAQAAAAETPRAPSKPSVGDVEPSERARKYGLLAFNDLQKMCKERGINCVGKSKAWMAEAIAEKEADHEPAGQAAEAAAG